MRKHFVWSPRYISREEMAVIKRDIATVRIKRPQRGGPEESI